MLARKQRGILREDGDKYPKAECDTNFALGSPTSAPQPANASTRPDLNCSRYPTGPRPRVLPWHK